MKLDLKLNGETNIAAIQKYATADGSFVNGDKLVAMTDDEVASQYRHTKVSRAIRIILFYEMQRRARAAKIECTAFFTTHKLTYHTEYTFVHRDEAALLTELGLSAAPTTLALPDIGEPLIAKYNGRLATVMGIPQEDGKPQEVKIEYVDDSTEEVIKLADTKPLQRHTLSE